MSDHGTLSRRLARQRDEILAHVNDPSSPFRRFDVVGEVGSGKSALLGQIAEHCRARGVLVLDIAVLPVTQAADASTRERHLADALACAELIASFMDSINRFGKQHPESTATTSRAIEALAETRNPQVIHYHVVNMDISVERSKDLQSIGNVALDGSTSDDGGLQEQLTRLRDGTESALLDLGREYKLAILIDDVHQLDGTATQDSLRALLRRIPTVCTVTTRRPGSDKWSRGHANDDRIIEIQNMDLDEVSEYLKDRHLEFGNDEARKLFDWTAGHGFAVATWCALALDSGVSSFTELVDYAHQATVDHGFVNLTERVGQAVDQIPVDVLGYKVPLFALLAVARVITADLIIMLDGGTEKKISSDQAEQIYSKLADKSFMAAIDDKSKKGVYLTRAISDMAERRLRKNHLEVFRKMHSYAELHQRKQVNLDREFEVDTPLKAWTRFEIPVWVRTVEGWLDHARWLDRQQFEQMKPTLVKLYLDAFWWWDDYLGSLATSLLRTALKRVADQQHDTPWMNAIEKFSDHWVQSWDETELRADPSEWQSVMEALTALRNMFNLQRTRIPSDLTLRRILILICQFYGKAVWFAGEADVKRANEADKWLAAAAAACATQEGEKDADNPNGWIGSWAQLRRAEVWSTLDPPRSAQYLDGLDSKALEDEDSDLRVGIAMLIGDLRWRNGELDWALEAYSRALLISYAYNARQEATRKAPNLYTQALYASIIRRVEKQTSELENAGDFETLNKALGTMRELFGPYWDRINTRADPSSELPRFALPVPPPPNANEISMLEEKDESSALASEYVMALEELAVHQEEIILQTSDQRLG